MVTIIARSTWGARHERGDGPAPLPAKYVYLHHSVTIAPDLVPPFDDEYAAMRTLENIGEQRFGRGISYTFGIVPTGNIYEGHGIDTLGAHTAKLNSAARAICFIGNYEVAQPTAAMIESTAQLLVHGKRHGWWLEARLTGGHRDSPYSSTACPGKNAYAAIAAINRRAAAIEAGAPTPTPEPIMLGDDDMRVLRDNKNGIHLDTGYDVQSTGDNTLSSLWQRKYGTPVAVTEGEVGTLRADNQARRTALLTDLAKAAGGDVDVDEAAIVAGLLPKLSAAVEEASQPDGSLTRDDVLSAVREVFATAATPAA